jgi:hypothetical protein
MKRFKLPNTTNTQNVSAKPNTASTPSKTLTMTKKVTKKISTDSNITARGFNYFPQLTLRLLGAFGNAAINSPRTKQHIYKPHIPTHNQSLQKSCFLALTPIDNCIFGFLINICKTK